MMRFRRALLAIAGILLGGPSVIAEGPHGAFVTIKSEASGPRRLIENLTRVVEVSPDTVVTTGRRGDGLSRDHQILALHGTTVAWAKSIAATSIGSIIAAGDGGFFAKAELQGRGQPDVERHLGAGEHSGIMRFDADGRVIWARAFGAKLPISVVAVTLAPEGGLYLSGYIDVTPGKSYRDGRQPGRRDVLIVRLDALGHAIWARSVQASPNFHEIGAASAPDGGVFVGSRQLWRFDREGNVLWSVQLRIDDLSRIGNMVAAGDGVIVGGIVVRAGRPGMDGFAAFVDGSGRLRWTKAVDVGAADLIEDVSARQNSGVLLAGSTLRMGPRLEDRVFEREGWIVELDGEGGLKRSVSIGSGAATGGQGGDFISAASSASDRSIVAVGRLHHGNASSQIFLKLPAASEDGLSDCTLIKSTKATVASIPAEATVVPSYAEEFAVQEVSFEPVLEDIAPSLAPACAS